MFSCEYCCRELSSQSSLCNHRRICKMNTTRSKATGKSGGNVGRPTKAEIARRKEQAEKARREEELAAQSSKRSPTTLEKENKRFKYKEERPSPLYDKPWVNQEDPFRLLSPYRQEMSEENEEDDDEGIVEVRREASDTVNVKIPDFWKDTFNKGVEMLNHGTPDTAVKSALSWDKCFKKPEKLKLSLNACYEKIGEPLIKDKAIIDCDFREMDAEKRAFMKPILNCEGQGSKHINELIEDKESLEKELLYVNYGIKLRRIYPALKVIELMKSIILP